MLPIFDVSRLSYISYEIKFSSWTPHYTVKDLVSGNVRWWNIEPVWGAPVEA